VNAFNAISSFVVFYFVLVWVYSLWR